LNHVNYNNLAYAKLMKGTLGIFMILLMTDGIEIRLGDKNNYIILKSKMYHEVLSV